MAGACIIACECSLRGVNEAVCIEGPWKRRCEGMITECDPEIVYCM